MTPPSPKKIALVLSGGGARGAYEAGIIHYIRTMLPKPARERRFEIQCGSSVGAINSSFMAATANDLAYQGKAAREIWQNLSAEQIYKRHTSAMLGFLTKGGTGLLTNLVKKTKKRGPHFHGFLDTTPFLSFLEQAIPWPQISKNIQSGLVRALSISATNVFTGRLELFIEKRPEVEYTGEYITHFTRIEPLHAKASAAIPLVFPTVEINGVAYTDGGLRLNTPMSPAIQLGSDALFVIGLHHRSPVGKIPSHGEAGVPPSLGLVMGRVMHSIFLDRTQYDIEQLERINRLIDWTEQLYGPDYIQKLNAMLHQKGIRGDIANRGLKKLRLLRIRPSEDIAELFSEVFEEQRDKYFTSFERLLVRALDIDPANGVDFLSYIAFIPKYLKKLLDLGFEDAATHRQEIIEFLEE